MAVTVVLDRKDELLHVAANRLALAANVFGGASLLLGIALLCAVQKCTDEGDAARSVFRIVCRIFFALLCIAFQGLNRA
jgi:hypothetical protein